MKNGNVVNAYLYIYIYIHIALIYVPVFLLITMNIYIFIHTLIYETVNQTEGTDQDPNNVNLMLEVLLLRIIFKSIFINI